MRFGSKQENKGLSLFMHCVTTKINKSCYWTLLSLIRNLFIMLDYHYFFFTNLYILINFFNKPIYTIESILHETLVTIGARLLKKTRKLLKKILTFMYS